MVVQTRTEGQDRAPFLTAHSGYDREREIVSIAAAVTSLEIVAVHGDDRALSQVVKGASNRVELIRLGDEGQEKHSWVSNGRSGTSPETVMTGGN